MLSHETNAQKIPTSRVWKLREAIVDAPQEVSVQRARYLTSSMKKHWAKPPLTRMSLALSDILDNIDVVIRDGELIVGARTEKKKGAPLFPENKSQWIEGDLEGFNQRVIQRALITEAEQKELTDEILPFWRGKTVEERLTALLPADVTDDMDKYIFTMMLEITYGVGHFTMDHEKLLRVGLKGIIKQTEEELAALPADAKKGDTGLFYDAVIRSLSAAVRFANRYAELASTMAKSEKDPARKAELQEIAGICARVPEHPAQSYREAVQSVYFVHLISQIESGGNSISLGRIDQILSPYYEADKKEGKITYDGAKELLSLMFLKMCEIWNVLEETFIPGGEGTEGKTTQNVVVGGIDQKGNDAVSDMSYIGLDAYADIRTVQPNFGVRISEKTPRDFFMRAVGYAKEGVLMHFFNDEAVVKALVAGGHTLADARSYGPVGCLEPNAQGKTYGSTFAVQFNGIKCMELALSNGIDNTFGYQSGPATGDPAQFKSIEDVKKAYTAQESHFIRQVIRGMACMDQAVAELVPSPFASALIEGCIDKGKDATAGGAVYNSTGVQLMGFANVADSLYAIKKAVFDDKVMTIKELAGYLADDWTDAEEKRTYFLTKIPKYGNDVDEADAMAAWVVDNYCDELAKYKNYRGGAFWPGIFSVGFHLAMGSFTAATPDGRSSGDILGNGLTPTTGNAMNGPTAVANSVTKLPLARLHNGANLNLRFPGKKIRPENLLAFIKTYFDKGGMQVQFNMVDTEVLKAAQKEPEKYKDLVVRISGYSVLFTGLSDTAQDEIICRTMYEI